MARMRYVSTRDTTGLQGRRFSDILLEGLAADGGLYLPESYPTVSRETLGEWRTLLEDQGYAALAFEIVRLFVDDIPEADLRGIVERAYEPAKFLDPAVVPVTRLSDGLWLAHLSNGPSAAFKDMAMQLLGELFAYELDRRGETLTIVGATSGDTGSSAEYALQGKPGVRVFMLSPRGRMTPFQQAQMFSIDDPAIVNIAVDGVFDDCQDLVKELNSDAAFKARHRLGAVNSINWARLMAQVVYYFAAWLRLPETDEPVSFAVPSGNFGNIAAGHIAREMGLPIHRLILATNENNVLEEFFRTGRYRVRGSAETLATSSPSMDISKASNFERFICDLVGRDGARTKALFHDAIVGEGAFTLTAEEFARVAGYGFQAGRSTHADRLATIRATFEGQGVLIDTHTADGVKVARELREEGVPMIVLETALPAKFEGTIAEALGSEVKAPRPAALADLESRPKRFQVVPADTQVVKQYIRDHVPL